MKKISIYNKILFAAIVVGSLVLTSCLDDLNTKPIGAADFTADEAWAEESTYLAFLAKNYAGLTLSGNQGPAGEGDLNNGDQGVATFTRGLWNLQEMPTDEALCAWNDDGLRPLQFGQWATDNNYPYQFYQRAMLNVAYANEYLMQTTDDKLSERGMTHLRDIVTRYREEVRALRALNYYYLMDVYGNPSFITDTERADFPRQISRSDLFDWLESELTTIENNNILPERHYAQMSISTVRTILAKMYLNARVYIGVEMYDKAEEYSKKVIDAYGELHPNYRALFSADNDSFSDEIIFGLPFDRNEATCYGGTTFLMASAFNGDMDPATNFGLNAEWSGNRAPSELTTAFDRNFDRRYLFFETGRTQTITNWGTFTEGFSVTKFTNLRSTESSLPAGTSAPGFADTDYPLFRLADIYLMYVEALVRQNSASNDIETYFNRVRIRAGVSSMSRANITLDVILAERMRELYWEGHRRTDLIRFDRFISGYNWTFKGGVVSGRNLDQRCLLYPIPSLELGANPNLSQNPGYN